jgi:serine/threonine protein kinase/Tfp pilus assembly protein PilF
MHHEETIFEQALGIDSPQAREEFLRTACAGDEAMFQRLLALLGVHDRAGKFAEHVRPELLSGFAGGSTASPSMVLTEKPGDRIGRYKLLQKIGEGGCGVVYMAEQEEPVRRRVALKIIKLGMDTRQVTARFEAERQALALMDHPSIAKVHDAGATEAGRPYFVMELVRGMKITEYCDEKKLTTRERLELFRQVCHAVQHAHQKGIIHRDLKPSNILVSLNDGVAVPKVIDFGIAKATTGERLTDKTVFTAFEQFIGTPAYMSPEQALVSSLDIDTRTDIYALGVLLYELLTGHTPFDPKELMQAGLDEMRRTIREKEPARPSTRLSTLPGDALSTTAQRRGLDAPKLVSQLRGDLDWIVMKCLEKDRARRYETANGLASDVQRHLNNEAVVARPPSNFYRFQKMVRRNKLAFAAGAGIAAALVIGLAVALWQTIGKTRAYRRAVAAEKEENAARSRAEANEKKAKTESDKSKQIAQFLKEMLAGAGPEVAKGRDATILLEILDKTAERISTELTNEPALQVDLSVTVGWLYRDLGQYQKAETSLRRALAVWRESNFGEDDSEILNHLANAVYFQGRLGEAEDLRRQAVAKSRKFRGDDVNTAKFLGNLAVDLSRQGKLSEAKLLATESLTLMRKLLGDDDSRTAGSLTDLADVEQGQGNYRDAEVHLREATAILEKKPGTRVQYLQTIRINLAAALSAQQKWEEAESLLHAALSIRRKLLGYDHPEVAALLNNLGHCLFEQGKLTEAEKLFREGLEIHRKCLGNDNPHIAPELINLGATLYSQGKLTEAAPLLREAVDLYRRKADWPVKEQYTAYDILGKALAEQGNLVEAEPVQSEALAILRRRAPEDPLMAAALAELAVTLIAERKFIEAEPIARECLEFRRKHYRPESWRTSSARVLLAECLLGQKQYADAEPLLLSGYEGMRQQQDKPVSNAYRRQPQLKKALELLAQFYEETGRSDRAAEWKQKLAELGKAEAQPKAGSP